MNTERVRRQLPRVEQFRGLIGTPSREGSRNERRLARARTVSDLRSLARRRTPRAVFDYVDGAAAHELSLWRARRTFRDLELRNRVLRDVGDVDPSTTILGRPSALPISLAPTGFTRMMHHEGERAVAPAAAAAGIPYALSTMGTTSVEQLASLEPAGRKWFQLYLWRDREASRELIARARAAGYEALVLTVDTPVSGTRLRDVRNGLTIPPALTLRTIGNAALFPSWWFNLLTTEPLEFASFSAWDGTAAELADVMFDPRMTFEDLAWLREQWDGPLLVKGVMLVEDAEAVVDRGADGIVISNHGGRQLDRSPTPLEQLPAIVAAVGDRAEIHLDGGVLTGADVLASVALGARSVSVGRAYLYGLMAGGEAGVARAIEILGEELTRTMRLVGVTSIAELGPEHVRLRNHPHGPGG